MEEVFDVAIIGAGPGGYVAAIRAAQLGLKTVCIEKKALGGTCLNVGCIPSKTLLHATELLIKATKAGISGSISVSKMLANKKNVVEQLTEGIAGLFKKNKVTHVLGEASFLSKHSLSVGDAVIKAKSFIIATGSEASSLPFLPFDEQKILSSTGALELSSIPEKLTVIGAGAIGLELGSVFLRLGAKVHVVEFLDRACSLLDSSLSKALEQSLKKQGMTFQFSTKVQEGKVSDKVTLTLETKAGETVQETADAVLVAVGRRPLTKGLGLEKVGITVTEKGQIPVDKSFRTSCPHILAIGDVIDGPMLAHKASEEGVAAAEIIAGKTPSLQYVTIPNVVYTFPEVASVGLSEEEASKLNLSFSIGSHSFKGNARAKCMGEDEGFVKILSDKKTDKILGMHVIGPHASELIAQGALAISAGTTAKELGHICAAHPTLSESIKEASLDLEKRAIHK